MRNVCICGRHSACGTPELPLVPLADASSGTFASTELVELLAISD
jgi:hypothetical protein